MMAKQFLGQPYIRVSTGLRDYLCLLLQIFFNANEIEENKQKVPIFLNAIGARTHALLCDLLSPASRLPRVLPSYRKL